MQVSVPVQASKTLDLLQSNWADHPPNKAASSRQAKAAARLFSPCLARPNTRRPSGRWAPSPDRDPADQISQTAQTSPRCRPHGLGRVLLHALLTCCQVQRRRSAALCGTPRAPWRNSTILFQSGLKGTTKLPGSAARMETQHRLGSVRDQGSENRKAVDYGVHRYATFGDASISIRCQSERRRLCDTSRGERAEV